MANIKYEFVAKEVCLEFFERHRKAIYKDDFGFSLKGILSASEKEQKAQNAAQLNAAHSYYLIAFADGEPVGWSFGTQRSGDEFFMRNSAVLPAFRRSGIYTGMLERVVAHLRDKGFQRIYSIHKMANNPVLIAKLKFGFVLTGFKISDRNGCMAELTFFTNEKRKELYQIRVGSRRLDEEAMGHLL